MAMIGVKLMDVGESRIVLPSALPRKASMSISSGRRGRGIALSAQLDAESSKSCFGQELRNGVSFSGQGPKGDCRKHDANARKGLSVTLSDLAASQSSEQDLTLDYLRLKGIWSAFSSDEDSLRLPSESEESSSGRNSEAAGVISCTTFNILAPIYKRIKQNDGMRESEVKALWLERNKEIAHLLSTCCSSIICLQEFWLDNQELVQLYTERLEQKGYDIHTLPRTNNRGDGLLTAVDTSRLVVVDAQKLLFNDCGDRVAQVLRLRLASAGKGEEHKDFLVVNTHLLFPHNSDSSNIRLRQVHKILDYLGEYKQRNGLGDLPILLCGDWNGSKRGQVFKFLRSQGFVSTYDLAHQYRDQDQQKWVSHRNHRGNICGVDFIWLLNPQPSQETSEAKPTKFKVNWKSAVFRFIRDRLEEQGLGVKEAYRRFLGPSNAAGLSSQEFQAAMDELGVTGHNSLCLSEVEVGELVEAVDVNGNGLIEYNEFERAFCEESMEGRCDNFGRPGCGFRIGQEEVPGSTCIRWKMQRGIEEPQQDRTASGAEFTLAVEGAFLFPPEVAQGHWPENYSLSDHAPLTAVLSAHVGEYPPQSHS